MKNVLELLERTAARLPRQTAFADQQCSYDYQTVVNIAESVGSALAANGDRNCPVAVLMERGAPCLVTLMGVLYSGNFYVVLDPEMPAERVNKILRTLQPTALICDEAHKDDPAGLDYDGKVYSAEELAAGQAQPELLQTVRRRMIDTDPAYAIFTSGSTGNPKGVVVNHRSVLAYSAWAADTFGISEKTIFGNQTPFYFSMSVTDIYATIRTGAQLHVIPKSYFSFPALLIRYLNERQVNTIYWVPSALSIVANLKVLDFMMAEHIEKVLFAGEVMPAKQLNYWRSKYPNALFANLFGPTETTDICTYYIVDREIKDTESVPIGIACDNCDSFVVTEDGRLAGIGEEVTSIELCVTNRIRERVYSFYTQDFSTVDADTTQLDAGTIDAGMFNAVQQGIFIGKSCVGCHGTSTTAAAGLNLKEGVSYDGLVNRPSVVSPEWMRVSPGNSDESMLYQILASPISKEWGHDHSQEIESSIALEMLKDWIDSGAEE